MNTIKRQLCFGQNYSQVSFSIPWGNKQQHNFYEIRYLIYINYVQTICLQCLEAALSLIDTAGGAEVVNFS